jgi:predicted enzyme related to lactoylglutathione lyase
MSDNDSPGSIPGAFCWPELVTNDAKASKTFYEKTFGWQAETIPMAPGFEYIMFKLGEKHVAGMLAITPDMQVKTPAWINYINSTDVAADVAKAKAAGATIVRDELKVLSGGTLAIIRDPQGAFFGLWKNSDSHDCG